MNITIVSSIFCIFLFSINERQVTALLAEGISSIAGARWRNPSAIMYGEVAQPAEGSHMTFGGTGRPVTASPV